MIEIFSQSLVTRDQAVHTETKRPQDHGDVAQKSCLYNMSFSYENEERRLVRRQPLESSCLPLLVCRCVCESTEELKSGAAMLSQCCMLGAWARVRGSGDGH